MDSSDDTKKNFIKHVFNFEDESKSDMLNIIQYSLIAIIPVILLNKTMAKYVPEADENKGSLEIVAEVIVQIISMFIGLLIIHRVITYVPTYSGMKYPDFNIVFVILAVLMITLSLQTKLGEKVGVLFDRVIELWDGKVEKNVKRGNVKVSQPISGQQNVVTSQNTAMNQALYNDGTSINSLPTGGGDYTMSPQKLPNYDNMYKQESTPLVGAATPEGFNSEPAAASEFLGGGGFGSSW